MAGVGVFAESEDGRFELAPMGDLLKSETEGSLQGRTIMRGEPFVWRTWGDSLRSVKTGRDGLAARDSRESRFPQDFHRLLGSFPQSGAHVCA